MRESLTLVDWMEWGSHVFLVTGELPQVRVSELDLETRFELLDRAINRADGWVRGMLELSRTALVVEQGGPEAGAADAAAVAEGFKPYGSVQEAAAEVRQNLVGQRGWLRRLTA